MTKHWTNKLVGMDACSDAVEWAHSQPNLATAWAACERADWMLWLAGRCAGASRAAYAAYAAAYAAYAITYAYAAARRKALREADIVRRHYPEPPVLP